MAERSKAADCKSVGKTHVGSNPTPLNMTKLKFFNIKHLKYFHKINRIKINFFVKNLYTNQLNLNYRYFLNNIKYSTKKNYNYFFFKYNFFISNLININSKFYIYNPYMTTKFSFIFFFSFFFLKTNNHFFNTFFIKTNSHFFNNKKILMLNYKRSRFFPNIQDMNKTYLSLSLGMFSKFFNKGKSFIKNKSNFLVIAGFLRKVLTYTSIKNLILIVKRNPLFLQEILSNINQPVISNYKHPFNDNLVDEILFNKPFYFFIFIFINSKKYTFMKIRKKGRVKRKILKKVVKVNKLID